MKILAHKYAINRRQDKRLIIVETAIHRVSCLSEYANCTSQADIPLARV
ncbi:hypothetical protein [Nostoc sp. UHCC 0251]|nr:hypothetical protein [Nostoc sp. UHCC 0251]MEA5628015.1 hypothetical protein [Nostoc sp. UHCC 0251]